MTRSRAARILNSRFRGKDRVKGTSSKPEPITPAKAGVTVAARFQKISVRRARRSDLGAIDRLEQASFTRDRFSRRTIRRLLDGKTRIVIAGLDGEPVGYAAVLIRRGSSVARLYSIAVDPAARGRGVGDSLIKAAAVEARRAGATTLRLELRPSNTAAMRLYRRAGFTILDEKRGYYGDGDDAIRMDLAL